MKSAICLSAFVAAVISVCPPGNKEPRENTTDKKQCFEKERKRTLTSVVTGWKCELLQSHLLWSTRGREFIYMADMNKKFHRILNIQRSHCGATRGHSLNVIKADLADTLKRCWFIFLYVNELMTWKWNQWIIIPENLKYLTWAAPGCTLPMSHI